MSGGLRFGLSRSLGRETAFDRARDFAATLDRAGFGTVVPYETYEHLQQGLLDGSVHAAWAPPLICGRVEEAGGTIVWRAIRHGLPTYGAAVLRDSHYYFTLEDMSIMSGLRAAWVDQQSMGGYLLPMAALRAAGVDPDQVFSSQEMMGSYEACLLAVVAGKADVTACFYGGTPEQPHHGFHDLLGKRARFLTVLTMSPPGPHDGVALTPAVSGSTRDELIAIFRDLTGPDRDVLARAFRADRFDTPPPGFYQQALDLLGG